MLITASEREYVHVSFPSMNGWSDFAREISRKCQNEIKVKEINSVSKGFFPKIN